MMQGVMRLMGAGRQLRIIEGFLDQKIAEEQSTVPSSPTETT